MTIFDCEGDSLYPTKFHVLSYHNGKSIVSLTSHDEMREWLLDQKVLIGHNIQLWDIPNLERILEIKIKAQLIDTLPLSWYLYPTRDRHGIESWGEEFGVPKPPIVDWENEPLEVYIHRCEEDAKINNILWNKQYSLLCRLYGSWDKALPLVEYLSFKMDCAREQEKSRWKLDKEQCEKNLSFLLNEEEKKVEILKSVMPKVEKYINREPPLKPFKKDGTLSVTGAKWQNLLFERGLTNTHRLPISVLAGVEEPNPNSHEQIKSWLFSLGWKPKTFKERKTDKEKIPQVKKLNDPELCDSVVELFDKEPALEHLENLSIIKHRIGLLKGFLRDCKDGYLQAKVHGLTNTLRFKHDEIVNLPGKGKLYWEMVRGVLICKEGNYLVGSDMSALEDLTKRHYIYEHDPEYVNEMSVPGFDPHLDLAIRGGVLTKKQVENHKAKIEDHDKIRKQYKIVNYSSTYGIQPPKLSRDLKISVNEAKQLLDTFWKRNWAIQKVADDCITKIIDGQKWLLNPVSKLWYSLRFDKDKFSTLNQGTGVYCFDTWIREFRKERPQLTAQFHDEVIIEIKEKSLPKAEQMLRNAIDRTNQILKLNILLSIDIKHGKNYSEIH